MGRTALLSAALIALACAGASWLTLGFEVWTAEGARRLRVAEHPVGAPQVTLLGSGLNGWELPELLASPGRVTIVSFVYTRCPDVCRALGSSLQQLQRAIASAPASGPSGNVRLLSISFDPAHDDADRLRAYAAAWQADPQHWRMVGVPDPLELRALLRAWQVVVIDDGRGGYEHNAALLVVDERGRLVRIFDDTEGATALAFARAMLQRSRPGGLL